MTTPTKADLIKTINDAASVFLGFTTQVAGLKAKSRETLARQAAEYTRMAALKTAAEFEFFRYKNSTKDAFALALISNPDDEQVPASYREACRQMREAQAIWEARF